MARILAYTSPARGHLFPIVADPRRAARAAATRSRVRTLASQVDADARARLRRRADRRRRSRRIEHDDYGAPHVGRGAASASMRDVRAARRSIEVGDLAARDRRRRPRRAAGRLQAWGALAAAEAWGGPWASWCPYPAAAALARRPAVRAGAARPPRGPLGRLRDRALRRWSSGALDARDPPPPIDELRARAGRAARSSDADATCSRARRCCST